MCVEPHRKKPTRHYLEVDWLDMPCYIIGGGKSLEHFPLGFLHARQARGAKVIAINNAYQRYPKADLLYFSDRVWWSWHKDTVGQFSGEIISRTRLTANDGGPWHRVKWIERNMRVPLSEDRSQVAGWCSGANAINIAWLRGAKPIGLLGFDGGGPNWHEDHQRKIAGNHYAVNIRPSMERMAEALKGRAVVINMNPSSAYTCFPDKWRE